MKPVTILVAAAAAAGLLSLPPASTCAQAKASRSWTAQHFRGQQADPARFTLVEAEAAPRGTVTPDGEASGGKFVHVAGAYQPLIAADVPPAGESFTVWARLRGVAVQLKATLPGGKQKALKWVYEKPTAFRWVSLGRYTRGELGEKIVLIRGGGEATASAGIDALVLALNASFDPDKEIKITTVPVVASVPVAVTVDWGVVEQRTTPLMFGLNVFNGFNPVRTTDPVYAKNVAAMKPGLLRYHHAGVMGSSKETAGLIDEAARTWDADKVKRALSPVVVSGARRLVNIAAWPAWMDADKDGFLDRNQFDPYARLCADLVRLVNKTTKLGVLYWEVTNELDGRYYVSFRADNGKGALKDPAKPDRVAELCDIFTRCARAMKAVDPAIKVGGPAAARPDLLDFHTAFVRGTKSDLDFYSFHAYASGSRDTPDESVYDRAALIGEYTKAITEMLARESPPRQRIPLFLDEYNISWTWKTNDPRMRNNKGGVFDALTMVSAARGGADATTAWNERDGIYGKLDPQNNPRPGAHVFALFNEHLVGDAVKATTGDEKSVVAFAVKAGKRRALLLINRTGLIQTVDQRALIGPAALAVVDANGLRRRDLAGAEESALRLPEHSVTLLTTQ